MKRRLQCCDKFREWNFKKGVIKAGVREESVRESQRKGGKEKEIRQYTERERERVRERERERGKKNV